MKTLKFKVDGSQTLFDGSVPDVLYVELNKGGLIQVLDEITKQMRLGDLERYIIAYTGHIEELS